MPPADPVPTVRVRLPAALPPLSEVAAALGVTVVYAPFRGRAYGWFNPQARTITLASPDVPVFFHELAHAVHHELSYASNNPHLAAGTSGHH